MAETVYTLRCYVEGDNTVFPVIASSTTLIGILKKTIKEKRSDNIVLVNAASLSLSKVGYIMISV
jgi:hypothetical protein